MLSSKWISRGLQAVTIIAMTASFAAAAEDDSTRVYRWKDKDGAVHYGDYVLPEYSGTGHTVLNEHGVPIEFVAGDLSEEEQAARQEANRIREEKAEAARMAALRDKVLLSTYLSVEEIQDLRDRRVELLSGQIRITEKYLDDLRSRLLKLEREANRYSPYSSDPKARPIDQKLARELSETMNSIMLYEKNLDRVVSQRQGLIEKFAADITRFSELKGLSLNNE
jgi:hypothetical protein